MIYPKFNECIDQPSSHVYSETDITGKSKLKQKTKTQEFLFLQTAETLEYTAAPLDHVLIMSYFCFFWFLVLSLSPCFSFLLVMIHLSTNKSTRKKKIEPQAEKIILFSF